MATQMSEAEVAEIRRKISEIVVPTLPPTRSRLHIIVEFIGVVAIAGAIFWLGTLSSTVSSTASKVDKMSDALIGVSKDSLSSRIAVMETKMTAIETKLDAIDKKLDSRPAK